MKIDVMGVRFDNVTMDEALERAKTMLASEGADYVVTPNSEIVYEAMADDELKNLLNDGTLKDPCVLRTTLITHKDECLRCMIKREFDIAEFLFDSKIVAVYAVMADDKLANMVTKLDCGVVVNYELAATLAEGAQIMDKHEIIASVGVALDKVVDTQINQNSIYVYGETDKVPAGYTDVDFELFGLTIDQIAKVRCAFAALKSPELLDEMARQDERLNRLVALAYESAETGKKLIVEG